MAAQPGSLGEGTWLVWNQVQAALVLPARGWGLGFKALTRLGDRGKGAGVRPNSWSICGPTGIQVEAAGLVRDAELAIDGATHRAARDHQSDHIQALSSNF